MVTDSGPGRKGRIGTGRRDLSASGIVLEDMRQEDRSMSKAIVTRLFVGSLIAIVGGVVLVGVGILLAFANGSFVMSGPDVTGIDSSPFTWSMIGLAIVGVLAIVGGAIGQFVAWIGAVLNTSRLEDKTWFIVLLVLGLLSFGFVAMLVYVLAGPDGTLQEPRRAHTASGGLA